MNANKMKIKNVIYDIEDTEARASIAGIIDDTAESESSTYSSSKIEELIEEAIGSITEAEGQEV